MQEENKVKDQLTEKQSQKEQNQQSEQPKETPSKTESLDNESLKRIIEALVFASDKPLSVRQIKDIIGDVDTRVIRKLVNELSDEYKRSERSFEITEVAGGFQFATSAAYGRWLKKLYNIKQSDYLTAPSLETVAIIAYRQPVAKADIEFIRGVSVDGVIGNLVQKGLVRITGRKEVIGRPFLYGTTNLFLQYFGLNSLEELPALAEFKEADLEFQNKEGNNLIESNKDHASTDTGGEENEKDKEPTKEDRQD